MFVLRLILVVFLVAALAMVYITLPDIKRYLRMRRM